MAFGQYVNLDFDQIKSSLRNFEPRIDNVEASVSILADSHEMNCTVQYEIVGIPTPPQKVDILLFPARV